MNDEYFMRQAIALAKEAAEEGEVPVGAVVVFDGKIVGKGRNRREISKNALAHAEIEAINEACRALGGWRLWQCDIYVTLEPCPMCAGAIINSRLKRLVYGAFDEKGGACASLMEIFDYPFNHRPMVRSRILMDDCAKLLTDFFKGLRSSDNA